MPIELSIADTLIVISLIEEELDELLPAQAPSARIEDRIIVLTRLRGRLAGQLIAHVSA